MDERTKRENTDGREEELTCHAGGGIIFLHNEDLLCGACRYAHRNPGGCERFPGKPADILLGRAICPVFSPKEGVQLPEIEESHPEVVHTPQCVGCTRNLGGMNCEMFVRKPEELLMNRRPCPARVEEPAEPS